MSCPVMMRFAYDICQTRRSFGRLLLTNAKKGYISQTEEEEEEEEEELNKRATLLRKNQGSTLPDPLKLLTTEKIK